MQLKVEGSKLNVERNKEGFRLRLRNGKGVKREK